MRRIQPHSNEDATIGKDRRSNDRTARKDAGPWKPAGVLRVAVKSPDLVTRRCVVGAQPAIPAAEEHLHPPVAVRRRRAGPLAVQHLLARASGAPDHLARVFVHRDETWSARRWDTRMAFILAVG